MVDLAFSPGNKIKRLSGTESHYQRFPIGKFHEHNEHRSLKMATPKLLRSARVSLNGAIIISIRGLLCGPRVFVAIAGRVCSLEYVGKILFFSQFLVMTIGHFPSP